MRSVQLFTKKHRYRFPAAIHPPRCHRRTGDVAAIGWQAGRRDARPSQGQQRRRCGEALPARTGNHRETGARGSNKKIARELDLSESTVKIHVQGILRKLNLASRVQAAVYAVEHGLVVEKSS